MPPGESSLSGPTTNTSQVTTAPNGRVNGDDDDSSLSESDDKPLSALAKSEPATPKIQRQKRKKPVYAESSSDDDTPLASSPVKLVNGNGKAKRKLNKASDYEDDDKPKKAQRARKAKQPPKKRVKKEDSSDHDDEDDKGTKPVAAKRKRLTKVASDAEQPSSDDDRPSKKVTKKKKAKEEPVTQANKVKKEAETDSPKKRKGKQKEEEEGAEEVFKWWEEENPEGDGTVKWQTLEHNGVIFPPPYEPLPSHVKMKYNGNVVDLPPASEEVAGFYAAILEMPHAQDAVFNKNFFEDWKKVLKKDPPRDGTIISSFDLCDFRPIHEYFESEKARKKALSSAEKKELKRVKDELESKYTTCLLDGRKEKVGNFRVEPPGLFKGRGEHPKKGALKFRVHPEDITLNIGEGAPVPVPNVPGKWKHIQHDNTVTWLANWTENVNGNHKYVFLGAGSILKGQSDKMKFEKARELKDHVDRIRRDYNEQLKSKVMADRQRATAMYFIDKLALRAGNEKGEDEADTVGCCSLRCQHVTLEAPSFIVFDFFGKDSIRYYNRVPVEPQIFKNIRIFKENKNEDDALFDRVTTGSLNKHLASYMKGLTAKVFRTYNASITFQEQLDAKLLKGVTVQEKLNSYNQANRTVAILCNHQRTVPKTHEQSMEKMRTRLLGIKYERMKLRHVLFKIDSAFQKKKKYAADESDLDDDFIESHEEELKAKEIEKATKKFTKENEKLAEEGQSSQNDSVLREKIADIEDDFKRLVKERGTGKAALKRDRPTEKIEASIDKLSDRINAFKLQIDDRDAGKEVALNTSKINYLDPRITVAWCKIHEVPIEKIFSKTLLTKFPWAMEVDTDWKF